MRQWGFCFAMALSLALSAGAQETKTGERGGFAPPPGAFQTKLGQPSPEELKKRKDERQKWLVSLKLTPEQKKKWDEIEARTSKVLKEKFAKQGAKDGRIVISGGSADAMKALQEIQELQKKKRDEQRALLTPAQRVVFDKAPDPGFRTHMIQK